MITLTLIMMSTRTIIMKSVKEIKILMGDDNDEMFDKNKMYGNNNEIHNKNNNIKTINNNNNNCLTIGVENKITTV